LQPLLIRSSRDADVPAISAIYDVAVRTGTASFELEAPDGGWKFERWLDVVFMRRALGCGAAAPAR
jgi:phosphinothricin acetyltransferase